MTITGGISRTIVVLFALKGKLSGPSLIILFFFALLNPLLHFYALETRSYAFMVFLSAFVMVSWIRGWVWSTILGCAALGSTHYFGTLVALIYLLRLFAQNPLRGARVSAVLCALAILIWPLLQLSITGVRDLTGGNFWIQAQGVDIFVNALDATLPAFSNALDSIVNRISGGITWLLPIVVIVVLLALLWPAILTRRNPDSEMRIAADAARVFLTVAIAMFIVDFHTPMGTIRNFLVLAPQMSLVIAIVSCRFAKGSTWRSTLIAAALIGYGALSAIEIGERLKRKAAPIENWREMTAVALKAVEERGVELGIIAGGGWIEDAHKWYLPEDVEPLAYDAVTDWAGIAPSAIMFYDLGCRRGEIVRDALEASGRPFEEIQMPQANSCNGGHPRNAVFLFGIQ